MGTPEQRATVSRTFLETLVRVDEASYHAVRFDLGEDRMRWIEARPPTEWVACDVFADVLGALRRVGDDELVITVSRKVVCESKRIPLFAPIVRGAFALFGASPRALLRTLPRAYEFVNRDAGSAEASVDMLGRRAEVAVIGIPPVLRTRGYAASWVGAMEGVYDLVGVGHEVRVNASELERGRLDLRTRWTERWLETVPT